MKRKATLQRENIYNVTIGNFSQSVGAVNKKTAFAQIERQLYLSWFNDFISSECFAEYYGLSEAYTNKMLNNERSKDHKLMSYG